ncbi:Hypothetical protein PHPALM_3208 [Phytophthora palmivora]|uniref:Uncharacterized protein n=1 Tax=Phytophthora palmivora TaxID=4796 RepID=A0A2P4YN18_9STRA|nr:Hypothetical protein PHPALM_3208 [Phytophthora palmivora]
MKVVKKPLMARFAMSDVDKAQRNGVDEVFGPDCTPVHLVSHSFRVGPTNNPVEQYDAMLKRDVIVHRKPKMGLLLDRLQDRCRLESAIPFYVAIVTDARL